MLISDGIQKQIKHFLDNILIDYLIVQIACSQLNSTILKSSTTWGKIINFNRVIIFRHPI